METFLTICTPTYNREITLPKLYKSLKEQDNFNFEWIIIDDGSTDNTEEIVQNWLKENNKFKILYKKQENGGKHRAINKALEIAKGKMFFIVDSDDYLTNDAIKKIINNEKRIEDKNHFAGIAFCRGYQNGEIIGKTFKGKYIDATSLERDKYNIKGDKAEVFYTNILKENRFPEFEGEKFLTEALVWNRIANKGYKLRWFQDIIYIGEYRQDGLTKQGTEKYKTSPQGLLIYINETIEFMNLNFFRRLLKYSYYSKAIYENKNIEKAANDLKIKKIILKFAILTRNIIEQIK